MNSQINPPFDGSAPCAGCNQSVRNFSALIHNFLTRCDVAAGKVREGKAMVKLWDLRRTQLPWRLSVPNAAAAEMLNVARALVEAPEGMTEEGFTIRWSPEVLARVEALIPRAAAAADAWKAVSNEHFRDRRHSHGDDNVLRESKGYGWTGFIKTDGRSGEYDYTVEVVTGGGDLTHDVCGTHLKLHDHFKDQLALDPGFYGKVWCPTCRVSAPWRQFTLDADVLLIG